MVDPIFKSDNYLLAKRLLDASVMRQEAIAANIANAETPGYKRVDLAPSFASELRAKMEAGSFSAGAANLQPALVQDRNARSVRPDGNNVEVERELLEMNRNSVDHQFLTDMVSRNIRQLKLAITGRPV